MIDLGISRGLEGVICDTGVDTVVFDKWTFDTGLEQGPLKTGTSLPGTHF